MIASFLVATFLYAIKGFSFPAEPHDALTGLLVKIQSLKDYEVIVITAGISLVVWLLVTFLTRPEKGEVLEKFYKTVRPGGSLWKPIASRCPGVRTDQDLGARFACWLLGVVAVFSTLFGIGKIVLGDTVPGIAMIAVAVVSGVIISVLASRFAWQTEE